MKYLLLMGFIITLSASATDCVFEPGTPLIFNSKQCGVVAKKFCYTRIVCGEVIKEVYCDTVGPFSCPSTPKECVQFSISESKTASTATCAKVLLTATSDKMVTLDQGLKSLDVPLTPSTIPPPPAPITLGDFNITSEQLQDVEGAWLKRDCTSQAIEKAKGLLFDYVLNYTDAPKKSQEYNKKQQERLSKILESKNAKTTNN